MNTRRFLSVAAWLVPMLSGLAPPAQAATGGEGGFPLGGLLLLAVIVGVAWMLLRRREPPAPPVDPNPFARDDAFGRDPHAGGYPPGTYPESPAAGGVGSSIARGMATGLAVGAGAVVAQELGRRMFEHGHEGTRPDPQDHASLSGSADHAANTHSPLARDAGLGALDGSGVQPFADDFAGPDVDADPGWDAGFDDAGGDWDR